MATAPTRDVGWRYCYFALTIVNQFTNSTYYILLVAISRKENQNYSMVSRKTASPFFTVNTGRNRFEPCRN